MRERRIYWPHPDEALEPALDGQTWPCGHPRTPINTQHVGRGGNRCRICRRKITREHLRRKRDRQRNSNGGAQYPR